MEMSCANGNTANARPENEKKNSTKYKKGMEAALCKRAP